MNNKDDQFSYWQSGCDVSAPDNFTDRIMQMARVSDASSRHLRMVADTNQSVHPEKRLHRGGNSLERWGQAVLLTAGAIAGFAQSASFLAGVWMATTAG